jgi:hypothetical protein
MWHKRQDLAANQQVWRCDETSLPDPRNFSPQEGTELWKHNGMLATLRPAVDSRFFTEPIFHSTCPARTLMSQSDETEHIGA